MPKFTKLDFPHFNRLEDPLGWLDRCQYFFPHQLTPEKEKVSLASYHLEGIAQRGICNCYRMFLIRLGRNSHTNAIFVLGHQSVVINWES